MKLRDKAERMLKGIKRSKIKRRALTASIKEERKKRIRKIVLYSVSEFLFLIEVNPRNRMPIMERAKNMAPPERERSSPKGVWLSSPTVK